MFGRDKKSGRRLGFCILEFENEAAVKETLKEAFHLINGKEIKVQEMLLRHELKDKKVSKYPRSEKTRSNYYSNYETKESSHQYKGRSEGGSYYQKSHSGQDGNQPSRGGKYRRKKFKNFRGRGYGYNSNNSEKRSKYSGFRSKQNEVPPKSKEEEDFGYSQKDQKRKRQKNNYLPNSLPSHQSQEYQRKQTSKTDEWTSKPKKRTGKKNTEVLTGSSPETRKAENRNNFERYDSLIPFQQEAPEQKPGHQHEDFNRSNTTKEGFNKEVKNFNQDQFRGENFGIHRSNTEIEQQQQNMFNFGSLRRQETWKNQFEQLPGSFHNRQMKNFSNNFHKSEMQPKKNMKPYPHGNIQSQEEIQNSQEMNHYYYNNNTYENYQIQANEKTMMYSHSHLESSQQGFFRFNTINNFNSSQSPTRPGYSRFNTLPTIPANNIAQQAPPYAQHENEDGRDFQPNYKNLGIFLNETNSNDGDENSENDDAVSTPSAHSDNLNQG